MSNTNDNKSHKDLMPFIIFQNNLEMFGRVVKSSCDMSLTMLEALQRSQKEVAESPALEAVNDTVAEYMIPATKDAEEAAAIVADAMNKAATKALGALNKEEEKAADVKKTVAKVAPVAKPSAPRARRTTAKPAAKA